MTCKGKNSSLKMIYIFIPNVKNLRMFLMCVQLETHCKCLTTFCNRLFPSVLKTADDLMQMLLFHNLPAIFSILY